MSELRIIFTPLVLFLVFITFGCSSIEDGVWRNKITEDNAFYQFAGCPPVTSAITNEYGIAGVYISNMSSVSSNISDFSDKVIVNATVFTCDKSYKLVDPNNSLSNINNPLRYELEKGYIDFKNYRNNLITKSADNNAQDQTDSSILQDLLIKNIESVFTHKDNISNVTKEDILTAIQSANNQYIDVQLSNQLNAMNNEIITNSSNICEYLNVITNQDNKSIISTYPNAELLKINLKESAGKSLNQILQNSLKTKGTFQSSKSTTDITFKNYFNDNALSGDICTYLDDFLDGNAGSSPADGLIGGHSFIWNASIGKLLSSSGNAVENGKNGCYYFRVDANDGYLTHDNMWHIKVNHSIDRTAFEAQMNGFESRHHLSGYQIQNLDRRITVGGTYCNQVVWLNWWEYTGGLGAESFESVFSTSPLEVNNNSGLNIGAQRGWDWLLCSQVRWVTIWVQVLWWGFWCTYPSIEFYWIKSPRPDIVLATDYFDNPVNYSPAFYLKDYGFYKIP